MSSLSDAFMNFKIYQTSKYSSLITVREHFTTLLSQQEIFTLCQVKSKIHAVSETPTSVCLTYLSG